MLMAAGTGEDIKKVIRILYDTVLAKNSYNNDKKLGGGGGGVYNSDKISRRHPLDQL